jgi:DNA-binding GntR family transcriptional regulator
MDKDYTVKIHDAGLQWLKSVPARQSLGRHVYENLKEAIVKGELPPHGRVIENKVARTLGISRTPVREALHKLEREGLLCQLPTGGFFVVGLGRADIEEIFGIRSVLESYAAKLAAIKHQEEDLDPLEAKIEHYQESLDAGRMENLPQINTEFHDLLYALSHSPRLIKMINDLRDYIYRFREVILQMEDMARASSADHRLMLQSMRKRDPERVEKLVREHILRGQTVVLREFEQDPFD